MTTLNKAFSFDQYDTTEELGFVYLIGFSNGVVKPGKTKDIAKRFAQHKAEAKRHGISVDRVAITQQLGDFSELETKVIGLIRRAASGNVGEYLHGTSFDECLDILMEAGIDITVVREVLEQDEHSLKVSITMSRDFDRPNSKMKTLRWPVDLLEAIEKLRGIEPFSSWVFRACWEAVKRNSKTSGD